MAETKGNYDWRKSLPPRKLVYVVYLAYFIVYSAIFSLLFGFVQLPIAAALGDIKVVAVLPLVSVLIAWHFVHRQQRAPSFKESLYLAGILTILWPIGFSLLLTWVADADDLTISVFGNILKPDNAGNGAWLTLMILLSLLPSYSFFLLIFHQMSRVIYRRRQARISKIDKAI